MDLKVGSIPLRIEGRFFLIALLLGLDERDPLRLAIWVAVVLVSVVAHELGHAWMGRAFGLRPRILLHGMGGLTMFEGGRTELSTWRSIAISVAGPMAGFFVGALVFAVGQRPLPPLGAHIVSLLWHVNVAWGMFNLLPMLPLDGGNVLRAVARAASKSKGDAIAFAVSASISAAIGVWALVDRRWWILYLGVLFAFQNVQALRRVGVSRVDAAVTMALVDAQAALDRDDPRAAIAAAKPAIGLGGSSELRRMLLRSFVRALVRDGRWQEVMTVIEREREALGADELRLYAEGMRELERWDEAQRIDELVALKPALGQFRA